MSTELNIESTRVATKVGYEGRPVTKAPNWHGLVTLDILFNNLSAGLFLVTALGELVAPASFRAIAIVAYPVALLFLVADLVCLVLDLGDPLRFHHMLRVWKPSSPMSLGTWSLTAYAVPLTVLALMSFLPFGAGIEPLRRILLIIGLAPAAAAAVYKGVLFSTTAQPGWSKARWMGGYFANSALLLGAVELLLLATAMGQAKAAAMLRLGAMLLLILNAVALALLLVELSGPLSQARGIRGFRVIGAVVLACVFMPLVLLALGGSIAKAGAALLILLGAVVIRSELVRLPQLLTNVHSSASVRAGSTLTARRAGR